MNVPNYPPGVTGNEYAIAGPDTEVPTDDPCPKCGGPVYMLAYGADCWHACCDCDWTEEIPEPEPDPDDAYERRRMEPWE